MDVRTLGTTDWVNPNYGNGTAAAGAANSPQAVQPKAATEDKKAAAELQDTSEHTVRPIVEELNKLMDMLSANIQFSLHDRTKELMVKVVDTRSQRVLREYPSKEFLDTIANIRDYIGILLDKKA